MSPTVGRGGLHLPGRRPHAIREHAARAELAVDEIVPVADPIVIDADVERATV
jgi:hypothetical protein